MSRFAGHRQVVGSGAAGLVGAAGQAAMARPVMSAQIRTAWAVVEALVQRRAERPFFAVLMASFEDELVPAAEVARPAGIASLSLVASGAVDGYFK